MGFKVVCLEDSKLIQKMLGIRLRSLLPEDADIYFYDRLADLQTHAHGMDVLVADLDVLDANAEVTADYLLSIEPKPTVIVQSSHDDYATSLVKRSSGYIRMAEKAGDGPIFAGLVKGSYQMALARA